MEYMRKLADEAWIAFLKIDRCVDVMWTNMIKMAALVNATSKMIDNNQATDDQILDAMKATKEFMKNIHADVEKITRSFGLVDKILTNLSDYLASRVRV